MLKKETFIRFVGRHHLYLLGGQNARVAACEEREGTRAITIGYEAKSEYGDTHSRRSECEHGIGITASDG